MRSPGRSRALVGGNGTDGAPIIDAILPRQTIEVLKTPVDAIGWDGAMARVAAWARARESRYVCICNSHSVVTASKQQDFRLALAKADMATADGAPVAWMMRHLGAPNQERINGPDFMLRLCQMAAAESLPIFLFGSSPETLSLLQSRLSRDMPALRIAGAMSPPFRPMSAEEVAAQAQAINSSGAGLVFVSLGCPKQELWMAAHSEKIRGVMIGVGAAFDFHAGMVPRAPEWMRSNGLEWLHRLNREPRRLWKRYLVTNTLFILSAARQLLQRRTS